MSSNDRKVDKINAAVLGVAGLTLAFMIFQIIRWIRK